MNLKNRLKKLENNNQKTESCCDKPTLRPEPGGSGGRCGNCGNELTCPPNVKTKLILPKINQ